MRIRLAVPDELDDQERTEALNAALEAVTVAAAGQVRRGKVPPAAGVIKAGRIKWMPEPPGDEHFDLPSTVVGRGWGDCDDLAPYHAGSLRATGTDPNARAFVKRSGPTRWHALVRRGDGTIEDPSRHAGMGEGVSGNGDGIGPAIHAPMSYDPRLCIAVSGLPDQRNWVARVDVPDMHEPWAWSSMAVNEDPKAALLRAMRSAKTVVGEEMDEEDALRLGVLHDLINGSDPYEVAQAVAEMADDNVDVMRLVLDGVQSVGFLGFITKPIAKATRGIAKRLAPVMKYNPINVARKIAKGDNVLRSLASATPITKAIDDVRRGKNVFESGLAGLPLGQLKAIVQANPELAPMVQPLISAAGTALTPFLTPYGASIVSNFASEYVRPGGTVHSGFKAGLRSATNPMGMLSAVPGAGAAMQQARQMVPHSARALLEPGNAPARMIFERGVPFQQGDGPAFLRF
jgi:hypothetical protein